MSTCNQLDLQTLGSQPFSMPKNLPDHSCEVALTYYECKGFGCQLERQLSM